MAESSNEPNQTKTLDEMIIELVNDDFEENIDALMKEWGEARSAAKITRKTIHRDRVAGHERLFTDYFAPNPVYPQHLFRRRFRMQRHVFNRIIDALPNVDSYFQQRFDCSGRRGLSPLQKCTAAMRMLAYGVAADSIDDYVRIGESIAIECLEKFVENIILVFGDVYLRRPNAEDIQRLLQIGEQRGFPEMLGSIDCMHWQWKNCPTAWKCMYLGGHRGVATIILEAVASSDLWIWHAFFGVAGSNNDINVLDRSPVFDDIIQGRGPTVNYSVNSNNYNMGYYLTDEIYPEWATFVKTIPRPQGDKRKLFAKMQEAQRKDVERAFRVLQSRFAIIRGPALSWDPAKLGKIMRACIILHNMIVEDERDTYLRNLDQLPSYDDLSGGIPQPNLGEENLAPNAALIENSNRLRDRQKHRQLQSDLIEHIWERREVHDA